MLKVYDDDEVNVEANSLRAFQETSRSAILTCPELYLWETVSLTRGWLVIEKLPDEDHFLESPLEPHERGRFVELFCEYRRHFPREPNRHERDPGQRGHLVLGQPGVDPAGGKASAVLAQLRLRPGSAG